MLGLVLLSVSMLLYTWPMVIVREDVQEVGRTYTNASCYPKEQDALVCYPAWRLRLLDAMESLLLGSNNTLGHVYMLWSRVRPTASSAGEHWHFHQHTPREEDARDWVDDLEHSTCAGHFVAHRLSFAKYLWDAAWDQQRGPFVGLYAHFM